MSCKDNEIDEGIMCDFCRIIHPSIDFECDYSILANMILDVDRKVNDQWEMNYKSIENISNRVSKVEDDIISLYRKIEFYENSIKRKWQANTELSERLTKIEEELEPYDLSEHDELIHDLVNIGAESRLIKLERHFSGDYQLIASTKKPYKCPVCKGSGGIKHPLTGIIAPAVCGACEGKGIVWG